MIHRIILLIVLTFLVACSRTPAPLFDENSAVETLKTLSTDDMDGRETGTVGNAKARAYLLTRVKALGLAPVGGRYEHSFTFTPPIRKAAQAEAHEDGAEQEVTPLTGVNIMFQIKGVAKTGKTIVISAHYDHIGHGDGAIFNGADDNASGVAGVLAVAESFLKKPPQNDIVFALFDAEEKGLQGARHFVEEAQAENVMPDFNINFDMLSRSDKNELYVAGTFHYPHLVSLVQEIAANAPVTLLMGHDDPALGANDWTSASDHGPFHAKGIPFLYFGVEDHPHYHRVSDEFNTVPVDFFLRSLRSVVIAAHMIDQNLTSEFHEKPTA